MIQYGKKKRAGKLHPHDKCSICGENKVVKKSARQEAKKQIASELVVL